MGGTCPPCPPRWLRPCPRRVFITMSSHHACHSSDSARRQDKTAACVHRVRSVHTAASHARNVDPIGMCILWGNDPARFDLWGFSLLSLIQDEEFQAFLVFSNAHRIYQRFKNCCRTELWRGRHWDAIQPPWSIGTKIPLPDSTLSVP